VPHPSKTRHPTLNDADGPLDQYEQQLSSDSHESGVTVADDAPQLLVELSPKYKVKEKDKVKPPPSSGGVGDRQTASKIGTRLPDDWQPPATVKAELARRYPNTRLDLILEEFVNYWTALPGPKARKLDWTKTFINRVTQVAHAPHFAIRPNGTGTENAYAKLTALAQKYSQEDTHAQLPASSIQSDDESQGLLAPGQYG